MHKNIIFSAGSALIHRNIFRGLSRPVMLCQVWHAGVVQINLIGMA